MDATIQLTRPLAATRSAPALAIRLKIQVVAFEWVASIAARLAGIVGRWIVATPDVLGVRHGFQVIWIDAWRVLTQMIEPQASGDGADPVLVGEAVGRYVMALDLEAAIASPVFCTGPKPATIRLRCDLGQEPFERSGPHACIIPQGG